MSTAMGWYHRHGDLKAMDQRVTCRVCDRVFPTTQALIRHLEYSHVVVEPPRKRPNTNPRYFTFNFNTSSTPHNFRRHLPAAQLDHVSGAAFRPGLANPLRLVGNCSFPAKGFTLPQTPTYYYPSGLSGGMGSLASQPRLPMYTLGRRDSSFVNRMEMNADRARPLLQKLEQKPPQLFNQSYLQTDDMPASIDLDLTLRL